jgi:hypothetical protein
MQKLFKVFAATVGVLASLVAIWAFATGRTKLISDPELPPSAMLHTPGLGLKFEQKGRHIPIRSDPRSPFRRVYLTLERRPFTMHFPTIGQNDVYMICAWMDGSVIDEAPLQKNIDEYHTDNQQSPPSCFAGGTGIADEPAGSGTLFLRKDGHNHLTGLRLGTNKDAQNIQISSIFGEKKELPIEMSTYSEIYLVVYYDINKDRKMDIDEYDLIQIKMRR